MGRGALSNSIIGFHTGTPAWQFGTISMPEPSAVLLLYCPLAAFAPFWGSRSLDGGISPFSDASLPFFSLFLFFSRGSAGEVREEKGVRGRGWTTTSSMDPLAIQVSWCSCIVTPLLLVCQLFPDCCWLEWRVEILKGCLKTAKSGQLNTSKSSS